MIFLHDLIEEKLFGYENFRRYCKESGKKFVSELDREDFIAYRAEYSVPREQIEQIKNLLGFQEQKPSEEISIEFDDSLQKFFNVDDLAPYENIFIADLNFNVRVQNCLRREGYRTLAELLKASKEKISSLKNFGGCSFGNLVSTLKKFFTPHKKKLPAKNLLIANEELGKFLRNAALNHDPQVDLIIAAFEKFSASVTIKNLFRDLPDEFRGKPAQPFLLACNVDFFADMPKNLTLAELTAYLAANSTDFDADSLKNFAKMLRFDVKAATKKIVDMLFRGKRDFNIVRRRAEGATLEEIGQNFNLTRERVRQLEQKSIHRFEYRRDTAKKIIYFLHALTDGKFILTADDAKNFLDSADAQMFWFFSAKINLSSHDFHFNRDLDAFIFTDKATFDDNELIKNLPDTMEEKIFSETILTLAREKNCPAELIRAKLTKIYRRSGKFFHRDNLTLTFKCGYVLKERFPNGYKIADENFYARFVRYLQEIFDENITSTQHNIDAIIGRIGFLCERGKYIHPDFVQISPKIIESVQNFIENSDRTAIFYKEIFETLKNFFVGTQITNHYFLQGAIKFFNLPYILRKDYLTKAREIDMGKEFDNFFAERGEVSKQDIKENFVSFEDFNISFLLERCPEIIRIGDGKFIHATHLDLREEDFAPIKNFLRKNCSPSINSRVLFDLFFERFADFLTRNKIQNHNKLFGVLQYMFRDDFNFSRPYISAADIKDINKKKFLLQLLSDAEEIAIDDLISICDENRIHFVAKGYLLDDLRPNFVRVDEFSLMRPEIIGINDEIISAVVENVKSAIERNGGWLAAQKFQDYEWLPQLETPWNSFLLESVVLLADDAPYSLKIPSTSANFSTAIFFADEFSGDDFQTFLLKILSVEHDKEPFRTEKEIFDWLKSHGLCKKKLPKFLEGGKAFELLNEGR